MRIKFIRIMRPGFYYLLAALFLLFEMGVQSSPSVMASSLMHDLQMNASVFGLAMGCYFFSYTLMQLPVGLLFDRYSANYLLVLATLICSVGAYLFSLGGSLWMLASARFFTGFGSAFAFVGVLVIANQWFSARYFAFLVGIAQLVAAIGAMAGQMPLAYWVKVYGWRHACVLLSFIGFSLLLLMVLFMRSKSVNSSKDSIKILRSFANILRNQQTYWIALYAFTAWAPIALFAELWGVPYLSVRQHVSNIVAAELSVVIWIGLAVVSPILGFVSDRMQRRRFFLIICSLIGLLGALLVLYSSLTGYFSLILMMLMLGCAAAGQILCFALVRDHFPQQDLAVAIGFINMAVVVGGALFQPIVGFLLQWHSQSAVLHATVKYTSSDFVFALTVVPVVYAIGLIVSIFALRDVKNKVVKAV